MTDDEIRQWAGLAHLGGVLGFLPALVIWLVHKDRSAFVAQEAREALNFQLTLLVGYIALALLGNVLWVATLLSFALWVVAIVFSVMGFQAVNRGQAYRYPFALKLVR
ncbi:membrane protein [Cellulomonas bogoriensis 69B4 = DSM 16987]|uniref:Membrane protein n=2 Tax=Cellulomonas bogoriensis TaxID=301388 RepID=A0A0A0BX30_9CELL|nr:membrane protein [Cellulomonas bogoriensis 69B4 = DSM 16987]